MCARFASSPEEVNQFRENAENIAITADFTSLLGDIAVGMELGELNARLNANADSYAVRPDGNYYRKDERYVRENRRVTLEQAEVLQADARYRGQIETTGRQARDFTSFTGDILNGRLTIRPELEARLNANADGYAIGPNGSYYKQDERYIRENRQVTGEQADGLRLLFTIVDGATRNEARLRDLASFSRQVSQDTRNLSDRELNARLNSNSEGYATEPSGSYYKKDERFIRENRQVTTEDADVLRADFDAAAAVVRAADEARSCSSFFRDILSGGITSRQELEARLQASDGYAANPSGGYYRLDGRYIRENRTVSDEQATTLRRLYASLDACGEFRPRLVRAVLGGEDGRSMLRELDARYASSVTVSDAEKTADLQRITEEVFREYRRTQADADITRVIISTDGDVERVFRLLRDDPEEDLTDRRRAERLATLCYQRRRVVRTAEVTRQLCRTDADIDSVLDSIGELSNSPDPSDGKRAVLLRRYAYEAEVLRGQRALAAVVIQDPNDAEGYEGLKGSAKLRASVPGFNYTERVDNGLAQLDRLQEVARESAVDKEVLFAYQNFGRATPANILMLVDDIAAKDELLAQTVLEYYKLYLTTRRETMRGEYESMFSFEVTALRRELSRDYEFDQGLGTNLPAAKKLAEKFSDVILPLFESLRGEPGFQNAVERFISNGISGDREPRQRFILDVDRLAQQRDLSEIEATYLKSVQALTAFNPYLVAAANTQPGLTLAYLESYFTQLSADTRDRLFADDTEPAYVPLLQLGLGPNGVAALGEIMRSRPDLIGNMLVIDSAAMPGGPFSIPEGDAWDLNSANSSGFDAIDLPDAALEGLEGKRVRDYGGPSRWYPGERTDKDTRSGSINTTVDYLPTPDGISAGRYPTNEDLSIILQLQTSMLAHNLMLKTELLSVEQAPADAPGKWRVLLVTEDSQGKSTFSTLYTDGIITSSGLGEKSYGFPMEGSLAEGVLQTQPTAGFPKLSTTLEAFKSLASKKSESPIPGRDVVLYGRGNSTDTLLEYLGGLFQSGNPTVRNVRKIYVVGDGQLSKRPRYAKISDLLARNGRPGLVELVEARVSDVSYADPNNPAQSKLRLFDSNGNMIRNADGRAVEADHVVAATGFRSTLTEVFANAGVVQQGANSVVLDTKPVVLPTNPNVAVAQTVGQAGDILLVGTASTAGFEVRDKLKQLPGSAREALLRNGAENAVAIGFRAPDTQAAVRLYLEQNAQLGKAMPASGPAKQARVVVDPAIRVAAGSTVALGALPAATELPGLRRDIAAGSETLTPLLLRGLARTKLQGSNQNAEYNMRLNMNGQVSLTLDNDIPEGIVAQVAAGVADPHFQAYVRHAVRLRRGSQGVDIVMKFRNGRLAFKESYVQAG